MANLPEPAGFILSMLAALLVFEGIPFFGFPRAVKNWGRFLHQCPEKKLRLIGAALAVTGLLLLYAIKTGL